MLQNEIFVTMTTREPLDLRNLSVWDRAAMVLERVDDLAEGGSFQFSTEIDPRALINRLEQLRPGQLAFQPRHVGETEWHVALTRVATEPSTVSIETAMQRSAVFRLLAPAVQARIVESATERQARKNETICAENGPRDALGILLEGSLAVVAGAGTRERLLFHLFPFDTFGEGEFFDGGLAVGRTIVLSKTARYALVPYSVVREITERSVEPLLALAAIAAQRTRTLASALAAQVSQPILARVAAALLPYAAPERAMHPALPPLPNMTQSQVAAFAGTVKEVAARAIAELERLEALRRERGHIRYLDRTKLLEIASERQ
jgi:uncharacterized protein (DUF2249 family)